ncbi:MAG: CU044_2847 family protein [Chitinophagales bacterium]
MSNKIEKFESEFGSLFIEVGDRVGTQTTSIGFSNKGDAPETFSGNLEDVLEPVKVAADTVIKKVLSAQNTPSEVDVEFGLAFDREIGPYISKGYRDISFRVKVKWKAKED